MPSLSEIMTRDVFTAPRDATIADVATSMLKGRFGSALVVEGTVLLGIFTERDVVRAAAAGADPSSSKLVEWMTADPITGGPEMESDEAIELMMSNGFRHLPVLDGTDLVGIVSLRDILSARIRRSRS